MLVLHSGRVGWGGRLGEALSIDGGTIAAAGSNGEILASAPESAERIDMKGGLLLPAFTDAHMHLLHLGHNLGRPDLGESRSLADALARIAREAGERSDPVLLFEGADESNWPERRLPTREELDRIEPDRPLVVRRVCTHVAAANGPALERIGADREGVDRATGRCEEGPVLGLATETFPPTEEEEVRSALRAQEMALSLGVTTVHEFGRLRAARIWRRLEKEGRLRIRLFFYAAAPPAEVAAAAAENREGALVRVVGVKTFLDGSIGGATAAVREPYPGGGRGTLLGDREHVEAIVREAEARGLPVAIHAIGDRAIDEALAGHEAVRREGPAALPHRLEHAEMLTEGQAERVRRLGLLLSMQPNFPFRWGGADGLYENRAGPERAARWNRIGSWMRGGIPVAFGSDGMPFDPFTGIEGAVRHPVRAERIEPEEAVRAYSAGAERFVPGGGGGGAIRPGRRADLLLFDPPPEPGEPPRKDSLARVFAAGEEMP